MLFRFDNDAGQVGFMRTRKRHKDEYFLGRRRRMLSVSVFVEDLGLISAQWLFNLRVQEDLRRFGEWSKQAQDRNTNQHADAQ